jgi:aconitate hydratase
MRKAQGMMWRPDLPEPVFTDTLELDISSVVPSLAGPKRPQDRVALTDLAKDFVGGLEKEFGVTAERRDASQAVANRNFALTHGAVVIAAITSCTNTSNPSVCLGQGCWRATQSSAA